MNGKAKDTWESRLTIYLVSQGISLLGSSVVSLAIIWYVTLKTQSAYAVTGVTLTTFLPQAVVMLYGGVLADRYPLKKIVILSDSMIALSTLVLAVIFITGKDSIGWILFFHSLRSLGAGIQLPASKSILPQIVPEQALIRANSLNTGIWSLIQLVSPGIGGLVLNAMDMEAVLLIDVGTAAVSISLLLLLKMPVWDREQEMKNTKERLMQGFWYIMKSKSLKRCLFLYSVFQFLVVPASQLTPLLASSHAGREVWMLSVLETSFSVGALTVSILMAYSKISSFPFRLIGVSSAVFGITMLLLLPARGIFIFAVLMCVMGAGSPLYYTPLITYIQEHTEENYMGRTFSFVDLFSTLAMPLGMAVFGPLASVSIIMSFAIPGTLLIVLGMWIIKNM